MRTVCPGTVFSTVASLSAVRWEASVPSDRWTETERVMRSST